MGPVAAYRRLWIPELVVLVLVAAVAFVLFAVTDLDLTAARRFYHGELTNRWPVAAQPWWAFFYHSAPWITGSLAIAGAAALVTGLRAPSRRHLRVQGAFVLLCVILGPGLIVNAILKDHWGRPRPRQLTEFGGMFEYVAPLVPADTPGRSFPCGHCSVGYLYGLGWWIWRRNHPLRAAASLAVGLIIGTLLGLGRMAAGGHFLSDAIWSALIAYGVAHLLYYHVLRVPAREDSWATVYPAIDHNPRIRRRVTIATIVLCVAIAGGGIVASPHDRDLTARVRLDDYAIAPEVFEIVADTLDVELRLAGPSDTIDVHGYLYGFGLPTNKLEVVWEYFQQPMPTLRFRVVLTGWFPDIDGLARLEVPAAQLRTIRVQVRRGDISVAGAGDRAATDAPILELHTADGRVRRQ